MENKKFNKPLWAIVGTKEWNEWKRDHPNWEQDLKESLEKPTKLYGK
jgi:hypothetical protein